ncbi:T32E20.31 [Arabidopsis thaliana]|uniref:T32E20.31 n=1 Tax=Arabidopsis thaliana TaxID=3702 RepID=Q9LP89_ARATH|nr:T32E20.31 [Arabidopsis thaliana]
MTGAVEDDIIDNDTRLPPRLFATDRYPDARLNIYSRPDILTVICDVLKGTKEVETILDSCFGSLFSLRVSECSISCKLVHALLCRQLVTKQKYELKMIFGGQPLRFSLVEFGYLTGLPCGEFPKEKGKFELFDDDEAEDNDDEAEDIKLWVNSLLSSVKHEFAESVKKLRSQNLNLLKKIKALKSVKLPKFRYHKISRSRQSTSPPFKKVRLALNHHTSSESPVNPVVYSPNITTPPSEPLTSLHEGDNVLSDSVHDGDFAVSGDSDKIVDDLSWRELKTHKNETPSMFIPKFISANSTEVPTSHQPIYDTESKTRDEHMPSPQPPAVYDTATKPSSIDVSEVFLPKGFYYYFKFLIMDVTHTLMLYLFYLNKEIKIQDLSLAENVDTLVHSVCKNISASIAALSEVGKESLAMIE